MKVNLISLRAQVRHRTAHYKRRAPACVLSEIGGEKGELAQELCGRPCAVDLLCLGWNNYAGTSAPALSPPQKQKPSFWDGF
ncbi:MAG TPA: hypothetical protein DCP54_12705 [Chryseobacterium sp.]|nr:hypothetical protein [Chryseobacterium sp.]